MQVIGIIAMLFLGALMLRAIEFVWDAIAGIIFGICVVGVIVVMLGLILAALGSG